jgi:NodT family efflux transporter outer membrane factor (OMF) lipoprotein
MHAFLAMPASFHFLSAKTLAAILPAVILSACTSSPTAKEQIAAQVTVPHHWRQTEAGSDTPAALDATSLDVAALDVAALASWWTRFNDPVLDRLITGALANSPDIRTALSKISESRARRAVEKSSLLPTLSASMTGRESYSRDHLAHTSASGDSYAASLDAGWEIDLFGRQRLALDAATADLAQTRENFHAAQVSLAAEVADAYVTLRSGENQLAVLERNIASRTETTQLTLWREQAGLASALDSQQSLSTLEQARASLPSLRQTIAESRNRLALLCGRAPGTLDALLAENRPVPAPPPALPTGIPAETLRQRPDIRAAEHSLEAATSRTAAARRARLPSLNLAGSIGVETLNAGDLLSPDNTVASLLGSLTAPIFQGGRIRQNILIQTELQKQALIAYESSVLTALNEVENALVAVRRLAERTATLDAAANAATTAADLAAWQYEAGQVDLLTVLDAQRTRLGIEEQQVSATAGLTSAHIQLYKALGGGWGGQPAATQ